MSTNNTAVLANIPEDQRSIVLECLSVFLNHKVKEAKVSEFNTETRTALAAAITAITFVSPRLLAKARNEAEFQHILNQFRSSKQEGKIDSRLVDQYEARRNSAINELVASKELIRDAILGTQMDNYRKLQISTNDRKDELCEKIWNDRLNSSKNQDLIVAYNELSQEISILEAGAGFQLKDEILKVETESTDILESFAFLVFQPKHLTLSEIYTDERWMHFPLKWCKNHIGISQIKTLFDMFKDDEDVTEPYLRMIEKEGFDDIVQLVDDPVLRLHVYKNQVHVKEAINQAIKCYGNTLYMSSIYTSLPVIEGLLWGFSYFLDKHGIVQLYVPGTSNQQMIDKSTGNTIEHLTIGSLMKLTQFGDLLDQDFILYFCDELYNERNPILHGRDFEFANELNALKKLATLKYILQSIQGQVTDWFVRTLEARVPPKMVKEIIGRLR